MSPILRHLILVIAALLLTLCLGYYAERKLHAVDAACYTAAGRLLHAWGPGEYAQLHRPGQPIRTETIHQRRISRLCPPVHFIVWDGDPEAAELPLRQELATVLHCLATKLGVRCLALSSPLLWQDEQGEMTRHMLERSLAEFRHVGIGLAGRSAPQSQETPPLLTAALIPLANISGDASGLPSANSPLPYSLPPLAEGTMHAAPDYLEDEALLQDTATTRALSLPLLLRWNTAIYPSLPLRLALAELGLTPADVHVRLGKSIRIGSLVLPLDAHGRTPLGAARAVALPVEQALTAYMPLPEAAQRCAVLSRSFSASSSAPRAERLAGTLSLLLSQETGSLVPRQRAAGGHLLEQNGVQASLTGRLCGILFLFALLYALPYLSPLWRRIALSALPGLLVCTAWICLNHGAWVSLCAPLAMWCLLALFARLIPRPSPLNAPTLW